MVCIELNHRGTSIIHWGAVYNCQGARNWILDLKTLLTHRDVVSALAVNKSNICIFQQSVVPDFSLEVIISIQDSNATLEHH